MVLKGVDPLLGGELLAALDRMGHGDVLVLADRNFPAYSLGPPVIPLAVESVSRAATAILGVLPLDAHVPDPLRRMGPQDDPDAVNETQLAVLEAARAAERPSLEFGVLRRHDFYAAARSAVLVVHTLERAPYCDFLLTKGVV
jgi:L-fucose mutarotase